MTETLSHDGRYAEQLQQVSSLADKLEWALKAQVDAALENWWKRQGERCVFELIIDPSGLRNILIMIIPKHYDLAIRHSRS